MGDLIGGKGGRSQSLEGGECLRLPCADPPGEPYESSQLRRAALFKRSRRSAPRAAAPRAGRPQVAAPRAPPREVPPPEAPLGARPLPPAPRLPPEPLPPPGPR